MNRRNLLKNIGLGGLALGSSALATKANAALDATQGDNLQEMHDWLYNRGGGVLNVPRGEYDASGLHIKSDVHVIGEGNATRLLVPTAPITMTAHNGASLKMASVTGGAVGLLCDNMRSSVVEQVKFEDVNTCVQLQGETFYNSFTQINCYKVPIGFEVLGTCNANDLISCRITHKEYGIVFRTRADGWNISGTKFEGVRLVSVGQSAKIIGNSHTFVGGWYERGKENMWVPETFTLDGDNNTILGGSRDWGFSVQDNGVGNVF